MMPSHLSYLPHLDGLRAIALLGVLLFHFDVAPFRGGFAGVDVFLSLSGFLITRNIISALGQRAFSLRSFYTRRFLRLYPAAAAAALAAVLAAFFLFPNDLAQETAESALASMLSSANVYFHLKSGYFDTSARLKPLLHMWSLSLEEQFYLLWAPFLLALHLVPAMRRSIAPAMGTLLACSLAVAACVAEQYPSFAFYQLPTRIFQFVAGALLAVYQERARTTSTSSRITSPSLIHPRSNFDRQPFVMVLQLKPRRAVLQNVASVASLAVLITSYTMLPPASPPHYMIPTTIATCVLIALPDTLVATFVLAPSPARWLGRLSYSAYLVHWPVYVFARYTMRAVALSPPSPLLLLAVTLLLAVALQTMIEQPFRNIKTRAPHLFVAGLIALSFACAATGIATKGFRFRARRSDKATIISSLKSQNLPSMRTEMCRQPVDIVPLHSRSCVIGPDNGTPQPQLLLIGNSFLGHWMPSLHLITHRRNMTVRLLVAPSCCLHAPHLRADVQDKGVLKCRKVHDVWWEEISKLPRNSTVVAAYLWQFDSERDVRDRLLPILEAFKERGLIFALVGEPPGMHWATLRYFDCIDMLRQPAGRLWHLWRTWMAGMQQPAATVPEEAERPDGTRVSGTLMCGVDISNGVRPSTGRFALMQWYAQLLTSEGWAPTVARFINLWPLLCRSVVPPRGGDALYGGAGAEMRKKRERNETVEMCRVPVGSVVRADVYDPGYIRDGGHLSLLGGYSLADVFETAWLGEVAGDMAREGTPGAWRGEGRREGEGGRDSWGKGGVKL